MVEHDSISLITTVHGDRRGAWLLLFCFCLKKKISNEGKVIIAQLTGMSAHLNRYVFDLFLKNHGWFSWVFRIVDTIQM